MVSKDGLPQCQSGRVENIRKFESEEMILANAIERIGVSYCSLKASLMDWMFREQPVDDIGIDAHMECTDKNGKSQQLLALQIKSGESYFMENKTDYIVFRDINDRQYNYWTTNTLSCIVVLYNPKDNMCIWQKLTTDTIKKTCNGIGKGYFVNVPKNQVFLDDASNILLRTWANSSYRTQEGAVGE